MRRWSISGLPTCMAATWSQLRISLENTVSSGIYHTYNPVDGPETAEFDAPVQANQRRLAAELRTSYDFIVCGSGSSGSVVARRLAETGCASVLLLEAGGTDDVPSVREDRQRLTNFGTE